jgi:hypothetical protein
MSTLRKRLAALSKFPLHLRWLLLELWYRPELEAIYDLILIGKTDDARAGIDRLQQKIGEHPDLVKAHTMALRKDAIGR